MHPRLRVWACCAALCGCVSYPGYPARWAPLEEARPDCLSIGGVYANQGYGSRYGTPHLAPRVFRETKDRMLFEGTDTVAILIGADGTLQVTAFLREEALKTKRYLPADYRCEDGKVRIAGFNGMALGYGLVLGFAREWAVLSKSTDGTLVVEDGAIAIGLVFFVIPVPIAGFEWLAFRPRPAPPKAHARANGGA